MAASSNKKNPARPGPVPGEIVGVPKNVVAGPTLGARPSTARLAGFVVAPHPAPLSPTTLGCAEGQTLDGTALAFMTPFRRYFNFHGQTGS